MNIWARALNIRLVDQRAVLLWCMIYVNQINSQYMIEARLPTVVSWLIQIIEVMALTVKTAYFQLPFCLRFCLPYANSDFLRNWIWSPSPLIQDGLLIANMLMRQVR